MNVYFDYVGDLNPEDWDSSDREFEESLNHYFNHYCFALTLIVPSPLFYPNPNFTLTLIVP